jgi:hypothetical protein
MIIKFLKKDGNLIDRMTAIAGTPHQQNLKTLNSPNKAVLKSMIVSEVNKEITSFLAAVKSTKNGYLNSADVATKVCAVLNNPAVTNNFVGSVLLDEIENLNPTIFGFKPTLTVVASKGEGQKYFDYFPDKSTI